MVCNMAEPKNEVTPVAAGVAGAEQTKTYEIHDNGGRPYCVEVTGLQVSVFCQERVPAMVGTEDSGYWMKGRHLFTVEAERIWMGDNYQKGITGNYVPCGVYPGNSILLRMNGSRYVYIGSEIFQFECVWGDEIQTYFSPVGNSDVPYPCAVGHYGVYFMLDKKWLPCEELDLESSIPLYQQFYSRRNQPKYAAPSQFPFFQKIETRYE